MNNHGMAYNFYSEIKANIKDISSFGCSSEFGYLYLYMYIYIYIYIYICI